MLFRSTVVAALNIGIHTERGTPTMMLKTFLPVLTEASNRLQRQLI